MRAVGLVSLYTLAIPIPMAIPTGVVREKKTAIIATALELNLACVMHPPRPMPSNSWWKLNAAMRGRIVLGLCEAPNAIPIITEWTMMPNDTVAEEIRLARSNRHRSVRVAMRRVRVDRQLAGLHPAAVLRRRGPLRRLPPPIVRHGVGVHQQGPDRRHHGDEPGEREFAPRPVAEARRGQALEGVRQHVDEPRRQNHAGGECFQHEEEAPLRVQGLYRLPHHREADAGSSGREDGGEGGDFVFEGQASAATAARFVSVELAGAVAEDRRREEDGH
ncbi:lethal giant larvae protein homolog 1 [Striga asiatica]|uniref:Lethal giant larvae protein homolog 1 n=1 Tax=Striga asiatica TaxID=4170 RepID=A0A5A7QSL8_STRAF|nr:lethal giant larvae protein homolog 1 [Striga asiatica]